MSATSAHSIPNTTQAAPTSTQTQASHAQPAGRPVPTRQGSQPTSAVTLAFRGGDERVLGESSLMEAFMEGQSLPTSGGDGALFAQLLSGSDSPDAGTQQTPSTGLGGDRLANAMRMAGELSKALTPHLTQTAANDLEVLIQLPRMGRVRVNASRQHGDWHMRLDAEDEATRQLLAQQRAHCERALTDSLGGAISLTVEGNERI